MTMRVYVGTYAKYNNGNLFGKWFNLEDYADEDEFLEACRELHADEEDPELMFQDWEGIPYRYITESNIDEDVWELMDAFDKYDEGAVLAYLENWGKWEEEDFCNNYRGHYDSWRDMAEELIDDLGELEQIPEHLRYYFDYDKYANDLRLGGDFFEHDGHFFWNH